MINRHGVGLAVGLMLSLPLPVRASAGSGELRVLDVVGRVEVTESGQSARPVSLGDTLKPGTVVHLAPHGSVILLTSEDQPVQVAGPIEYRVDSGAKGAAGKPGGALLRTLWERLQRLSSSASLPDSKGGMVRGAGAALLYPISGIAEQNPRFAWTCLSSVRYRLTVRDLEGNDVYTKDCTDCSESAPEGKFKPGGMYTWEVVVLDAKGPASVRNAFFSIPEKSELERVQADLRLLTLQLGDKIRLPVRLMAEGAYYESKDLLGAALRSYREAQTNLGEGPTAKMCKLALESVEARLAK